jgi:hypothetical protein
MKKKVLIFIFALIYWGTFSLASEYGDLKLLKSDQSGITFTYEVPSYSAQKLFSSEQTYDVISIDKCPLSSDVGKPWLPVRIICLGLPGDAQIDAQILENNSQELSSFDIAPCPKPEVNLEKGEQNLIYQKNEGTYAVNQFYPQNIIEIEQPLFIRGQKIVRLKIHPVQYNPGQKTIRYSSEIKISVSFSNVSTKKAQPLGFEDKFFEKVFQNILLNYTEAKNWRTADYGVKVNQEDPFQYSDKWYKIFTPEEGIYRINRNLLISSGINPTLIDPRKIRVFNGGGKSLPLDNAFPRPELKELVIFVSGEEDSSFDQNDFILFYAPSVEGWEFDTLSHRYQHYAHPYTSQNIFWLCFSGNFPNSPKRMTSQEVSPTSSEFKLAEKFWNRIHLEDDKTLYYDYRGDARDFFNWYWMTGRNFSQFFNLSGLYSADSGIIKTYALYDYANISINGSSAEIRSRQNYETLAKTSSLQEGLNQIGFDFSSNVYFDWYEVQYLRKYQGLNDQLIFYNPDTVTSGLVRYQISNLSLPSYFLFDITDEFNLRKLENFQLSSGTLSFEDTLYPDSPKKYFVLDPTKFKAPSLISLKALAHLRDTTNQADFLIVTHPDFLEQAQQLKSFRESYNQMNTRIVNVQDIYDEFSWGLFDPTAIRDFLKYSFQNWRKPAPAFVVLLGDGNYDFKNNLGTGSFNWIPPFAADASISDELFVYFGRYGYLDSDSSYPADRGADMVISRIPVRTSSEAQTVMDKILDYEKNANFGTWKNLITLVADDEFGPDGSSNESEHIDGTETLAGFFVPLSYNLNKIYLTEYPFDYNRRKPQAEEAVIKAFNEGSLIINWMGHGNSNVWAHEWTFRRAEDIPRLNNRKKLTLVYTASCSIGLFFYPVGEGMAEELLRAVNGGAIGIISATYLVYSGPNATLNYKVYDLLLQDSTTLGEALYIAKFLRGPNFNDRKFILFGDPVLKLATPRLKVEFTQISPDTIKALSLLDVSGEVKYISGSLKSDFNGTVYLLAFDSEKKRTHQMPGGGIINYTQPGSVFFRGEANVLQGKFQANFRVPKDISYGGDKGKISGYVSNNQIDGAGALGSLIVGGSDTTVIDTLGPEITINFLGHQGFSDGDFVEPQAVLELAIADSNGVNITGELGHGIILTIDGDYQNQKELTANFEYETGSYQKGKVLYQLSSLNEGKHNLEIKAWDNANNSSVKKIEIAVVSLADFKITELLNYPNPFSEFTNFSYQLSSEAEKVEIKIFTLSGKPIRTIEAASSSAGYNYNTVWDGKDQDGEKVASGVYIYKVVASPLGDENKKAVAFGKALVMH